MWKKNFTLMFCFLLLGCQSPPYLHQFYAPKEQHLNKIILQCESFKLNYAMNDTLCQQAAAKGIYWELPKYYKHCCCCVGATRRY